MRISYIKNTTKSIFWGIVNKLVIILMPFVIRTILIYYLSAEYAGLSSLFTSILRVLNMAELGFAGAVAFSMYKPVAEEDTEKICALLAFYRKLYYGVGSIVMIIGIAMIPYLNFLVKGDCPADINLQILYVIYLIDTAASYFLFSYKNVILNVYQRIDIVSNISTVLHICIYGIQIIILVFFRSYYAYIIFEIVYTVINNIMVARYVTKLFPQYKCAGKLKKGETKSILKNVYGMMLFKVCSVTRNSLDNIFISAFIGLKAVAVYGNYYYVFSALANVQAVIMDSIKGAIGNKIAIDTPEKNHHDMLVFMFIYAWFSGWCSICMLCLYQPFIRLWVGDSMLLDTPTMFMFCFYFYVTSMGAIRFLYHQSAGLFWQWRYWTVAEALVNVVGNYILVQVWGLFGVVAATIISLLVVDFFFSTFIVYKFYFKNGKIWIYFRDHLLYLTVTALAGGFTYIICEMAPDRGVIAIIIRLGICAVLPNFLFLLAYYKLAVFKDAVRIGKRVMKYVTKKQ